MPKALNYRTTPDGSFLPDGEEETEATAATPSSNDLRTDPPKPLPEPEAAANSDTTQTTEAIEAEPVDASVPTGRQLRMARRIAQKHGIKVGSDQEAVAALRARGIDPFERSNMLQLVPGRTEAEGDAPEVSRAVAPIPAAPITISPDERAGEIVKIQRDIARRRRRRLMLLGSRLACFVGLPTIIAGYYFYVIATPMYATKSEFIIQQAESAAGGAGGLGSLFSGTGFANQTDSTAVQSYLLSREALNRLDTEEGFIEHFVQADIDPLQRLEPDSSREAAYKLYQRKVQIGYDPTEGVIKMEVIAADPEVSARFSRALIDYAEEQVDQLTARLRKDQMSGAEESYLEAEARMLAAQSRVVDLQEQLGVVSAAAEETLIYNQIAAIETEVRSERARLDQLLSNSRPNRTRVEVAEANIARLQADLDGLRSNLTGSVTDDSSLARVTAELTVAQQDLVTRQALLQQSAQQAEMARIEAGRQVRYLTLPVPPVSPDEATYPRSFENTILAFLIFSGIYLMVSLTAAVLREQVAG